MGVKDLWQLLSPVGRRVSLETLNGKSLAIDVSIWISQFIKAMRDEEGKMTRNAHVIGTLRRILRLLFHRIRPIFVFDGQTPLLKMNTIKARRSLHEKQEVNKRSLAQKILLSQLKQAMLKKSIDNSNNNNTNNNNSNNSNNNSNNNNLSQYSDSFIPFNTSENNPSSTTKLNKPKSSMKDDNNNDDDVNWEDGYEDLNNKELNDENSQQEEMNWFIPDNSDELDIDALSALPSHLRKDLIEEARKKERMKSRQSYIPVAGDPTLYSQTQLANFLNTSKLNRKFHDVQKKIDGLSKGKRIAADGKKKFLLIETSIEKNQEEDVDTFFMNMDDSDDEKIGNQDGDEDTNNNNNDDNNNKEDEDLEKVWESKAFDGKYIKTKHKIASKKIIDINDDDDDENIVDVVSPVTHIERSPLQSNHIISTENEFLKAKITSSGVEDEMKIANNFYQNLHNNDSEDDCNDVDWQSEDNNNSESCDSSVEFVNNNNNSNNSNNSNNIDDSATNINDSNNDNNNASNLQFQQNNYQPILLTSAVIDRAVHTASHMTDWAGRAVRHALKEHMKNMSEKEKLVSPTAEEDFVDHNKCDNIETDEKEFIHHSSQSANVNNNNFNSDFSKDNIDFSNSKEAIDSCGTNNSDDSPLPSTNKTNEVASGELKIVGNDNIIKDKHNDEIVEQFKYYNENIGNETAQSLLLQEAEDEQIARRNLSLAKRDSESLTEEMKQEVIDLIKAFNLPYIIAPFEAEAQCAVLEQLGLVDGVVTEDSDTFLFGAKTVYRNIFMDKKFAEVYTCEDINSEMGLEREDLVALAFFLGSDYTDGINGIGIVNALEIVQTFSMKQSTGGPVQGLKKFKEWLEGYNFAEEVISLKNKMDSDNNKDNTNSVSIDERLVSFQEKHKSARTKWIIPPSFPNEQVSSAYLNPKADNNASQFVWTLPNIVSVRKFCGNFLGMTEKEMDLNIDPVIKKYCESSYQPRVDSYFVSYKDNKRFAAIASSRMYKAVTQITGKKTNLLFVEKDNKKKRKVMKDNKENK